MDRVAVALLFLLGLVRFRSSLSYVFVIARPPAAIATSQLRVTFQVFFNDASVSVPHRSRSRSRSRSMIRWGKAADDDMKWDPNAAPKLDFDEDLYSVLEVDPAIAPKDLKKAYYKIVFKYHPDNKESAEAKALCNKQMMVINAAYKVLKDADARTKYDRKRRVGAYGGSGGRTTTSGGGGGGGGSSSSSSSSGGGGSSSSRTASGSRWSTGAYSDCSVSSS